MKGCSVEGCPNKHLSKGLCRKHYLRVWRTGSLEVRVLHGASAADRVRQKIKVTNEGCWEFQGALSDGRYGQIRDGEKMRQAHIIMYEEEHGPVPDGLELDHLCKNTICCRPLHLEPVTHSVNVQRGRVPVANLSRPRGPDGKYVSTAELV